MSEIYARTCHICEANCGTLMTIEGNKVTKVTGNPDHVLSKVIYVQRPLQFQIFRMTLID